ncbi:hypothetical protein NE619_18705, partial [Anaerovorax odorimutans]
IATVASDADEEEIIDQLIDRFGEIPRDTMNLITISRIRSMAEKLSITRIHDEGSKVIFNFAQENGLRAKSLSALYAKY